MYIVKNNYMEQGDFMFDTHVHTAFSTDSKMKIQDALDSAEKRRLNITITEHMDIGYPEKGEFIFEPSEYFSEYSRFREKGVLLGIEIGMKEESEDKSRLVVCDNPFDFVLGSIHLVDDIDLYYSEYYEGRSKEEAYERYLCAMLNNLKKFDFIDSLAHIDYIARYAKYSDCELYYGDFPDLIDEILKTLIDTGKCIELNTKRLENENSRSSLVKIYKRYCELGGRYITVGSDAHDEGKIGCNFDIAFDISSYCGLKVVYFKNRNMEYSRDS